MGIARRCSPPLARFWHTRGSSLHPQAKAIFFVVSRRISCSRSYSLITVLFNHNLSNLHTVRNLGTVKKIRQAKKKKSTKEGREECPEGQTLTGSISKITLSDCMCVWQLSFKRRGKSFPAHLAHLSSAHLPTTGNISEGKSSENVKKKKLKLSLGELDRESQALACERASILDSVTTVTEKWRRLATRATWQLQSGCPPDQAACCVRLRSVDLPSMASARGLRVSEESWRTDRLAFLTECYASESIGLSGPISCLSTATGVHFTSLQIWIVADGTLQLAQESNFCDGGGTGKKETLRGGWRQGRSLFLCNWAGWYSCS